MSSASKNYRTNFVAVTSRKIEGFCVSSLNTSKYNIAYLEDHFHVPWNWTGLRFLFHSFVDKKRAGDGVNSAFRFTCCFIKKGNKRDSKMIQLVKTLASKSNDLSSIPGTLMMDGGS